MILTRIASFNTPPEDVLYAVHDNPLAQYTRPGLDDLGVQYESLAFKGSGQPTPKAATNPKQAFGDTKIPVGLVPLTFIYGVAVALFEGASKYGRWNWRKSKVEASTYVHATGRHLFKWYHGENCDPVTRINHLYNAAASLCILIDAEVAGTLIDDRPPAVDTTKQVHDLEATVVHLRTLFKDHTPTHHTGA